MNPECPECASREVAEEQDGTFLCLSCGHECDANDIVRIDEDDDNNN